MHAAIVCSVISMHVAMQLVDPEVGIYLFDSLYFTQGGPPLFYPSVEDTNKIANKTHYGKCIAGWSIAYEEVIHVYVEGGI